MNLSGISRKAQILGSGSMARLCACHGVADDGDVPLLEFPDAFPLVQKLHYLYVTYGNIP